MTGIQRRIATRIAELAVVAALLIPRGAAAQLSESTIHAMAAEAEEDLKANGFEFEYPDLDGNPVTLDDARFKGKVVLIDIWGTWCPPCRREAPSLAKLDERFRARGLEIVGIAFERTDPEAGVGKIRNFMAEHGATYTALIGGRIKDARVTLPRTISRLGYPAVIIMNRAGEVEMVEAGFWPTSAENIEKKVVELLGDEEER